MRNNRRADTENLSRIPEELTAEQAETVSGGSLTAGQAYFNPKEITVDKAVPFGQASGDGARHIIAGTANWDLVDA